MHVAVPNIPNPQPGRFHALFQIGKILQRRRRAPGRDIHVLDPELLRELQVLIRGIRGNLQRNLDPRCERLELLLRFDAEGNR
jgi:hypothetical protein